MESDGICQMEADTDAMGCMASDATGCTGMHCDALGCTGKLKQRDENRLHAHLPTFHRHRSGQGKGKGITTQKKKKISGLYTVLCAARTCAARGQQYLQCLVTNSLRCQWPAMLSDDPSEGLTKLDRVLT